MEVSENSSEPQGAQAGHVLEHDPFGAELSDDVVDVGPEPPFVVFSEAGPGEAGGLAWEAGRDEVGVGTRLSPPPVDGGADVVMTGYLRPVPREDGSAERVELYLADDGHAGAFEAELETADAGTQGQDVHDAPSSRRLRSSSSWR
jgi:hypothetical protein